MHEFPRIPSQRPPDWPSKRKQRNSPGRSREGHEAHLRPLWPTRYSFPAPTDSGLGTVTSEAAEEAPAPPYNICVTLNQESRTGCNAVDFSLRCADTARRPARTWNASNYRYVIVWCPVALALLAFRQGFWTRRPPVDGVREEPARTVRYTSSTPSPSPPPWPHCRAAVHSRSGPRRGRRRK